MKMISWKTVWSPKKKKMYVRISRAVLPLMITKTRTEGNSKTSSPLMSYQSTIKGVHLRPCFLVCWPKSYIKDSLYLMSRFQCPHCFWWSFKWWRHVLGPSAKRLMIDFDVLMIMEMWTFRDVKLFIAFNIFKNTLHNGHAFCDINKPPSEFQFQLLHCLWWLTKTCTSRMSKTWV